MVISPVFVIQSAKDRFQDPTTRINELWQTDFTYFKIIGWGWYRLSTVLDDYSRMILGWKLCSSMSANDVKDTLDIAIEFTGVDDAEVVQRIPLLSDNGPCYISKSLQEYLEVNAMDHTRGRAFHPMTQAKIERWVGYYNDERYHQSLGKITPRDKYLGRDEEIFAARRKIKKETMKKRRKAYRDQKLRAGESADLPVS